MVPQVVYPIALSIHEWLERGVSAGVLPAAYIVSRLFHSPAADSNHPKYRAVLSRLNWLHREGYIDAYQRNAYTPTRWFKK